MPKQLNIEVLAEVAYIAYCDTRQWKAFNGDRLPPWPEVKEEIKEGWRASAAAVGNALENSPMAYLKEAVLKDEAACGWCGTTLGLIHLLNGAGPYCCQHCLETPSVLAWLEARQT